MTRHAELTRLLTAALLSSALLSGCGKHEPPAPAAAAADTAPPKRAFVSTVAHGSTVDAVVGGVESQQALTLSDGATATGMLTSTATGTVVGAQAYVGNYVDSATGPFELRLCVADRCANASVDAVTSIDNEMLEFPLQSPLELVTGDVVTYTFSRPAGTNPIALWVYSSPVATDHLVEPSPVTHTPRLSLLLK